MKGDRWQTTKQAQIPCDKCGKMDTCKVSPDGNAFWCTRNGNKVYQKNVASNGSANGAGYVGAAHRSKPSQISPKTFATADEAIAAATKQVGNCMLVRTDCYFYEDGNEAMRVLRFDVVDGDKEFRPIHPHKGKWKIGDPSGTLPMFRLLELLKSDGPVIVTEGEKAADAAASIGFTAVTSSHGSASPEKTDWSHLAGRFVSILIDNDEPGEKYGRLVARILLQLDPPARVKIVKLPGLPAGGDVVEFIAAHPGRTPLQLNRLVEQAINVTPEPSPEEIIGGPVLICAADVVVKKVDWLWPGKIPLGRLSLLAGRPGGGKSFLTADATSRVTTGTPWPDDSECPIGSVLMANAEDDAGDTTVPRLEAHNADLTKVHFISTVKRVGEDGKPTESMFTLADLPALEMAMKRIGDLKLVVIDPIGSYLGGSVDAHRDNEVRSVLAPVARLAEKYNCAVLIVCHIRKSSGASADDLVLGSRAFTGIVRVALHLTRDKENKARRLLLPGKNNLAPEGDGFAFTIAGDPPKLCWEKEPVKMSADEALAVENGGGDAGEESEGKAAAVEWLKSELSDMAEHPVDDIRKGAKSTGLAWRTVQRAANITKVIRGRASFGGPYTWRLYRSATLNGTHGTHGTHEHKPFPTNDSTTVPSSGTLDGTLESEADGTHGELLACQPTETVGTLGNGGTHGTLEKTQGNNDDFSLSRSLACHARQADLCQGANFDDYEFQERLAIASEGVL